MPKKRQQDFHKTKLRPGKVLPKGRNVTNTAFKAKKIIMPSKSHKPKSELSIPDCVKNACRSGPVGSRENALNQLNHQLQKSIFAVHLPEIVDALAKNILEPEESLRDGALRVLETVLGLTDDMKMSTFIPHLTSVLSCAMTHTDLKVKQTSLKMLSILLKSHPHLLCTSMGVLQNLRGLLSGQAYNTKSRKAVQKSNLLVSCGDSLYSQDWRIQVLGHTNMFLKALLDVLKRDSGDKSFEEEENTVYWDCKAPLHLEIFPERGLKPVDIEKALFSRRKPEEKQLEDPVLVGEFLSSFVDVLSQVFIEEIADGTSKSDDDLVLKETINNLSILFQVLSNLGDWVKLIPEPDFNLEKQFAKDLTDKIFRNIVKFPFIARGPVFDVKSSGNKPHLPCVRLNLSVCYLYSSFILKPDCGSENFKNQVLNYLKSVFHMPYDVKYDSIPVLLKLVKIYIELNKKEEVVSMEFLHSILNDLSKMLKAKEDRPHHQLLLSFFVDLGLQIREDSLMISDSIFPLLLDSLQKMSDSKNIDSKFLKNIQRIAALRSPAILNCLDKISFDTFKALLTNEHEAVSETAVFLISHLRKISSDFLKDLCHLILLDDKFPRRNAFKLIRLLTHKFTKPDVSSEDRVNFMVFLMNTAFDTVEIDERWGADELPEFTKIWLQFEEVVPFSIIPSTHWKRHCSLFEVCLSCLKRFPQCTFDKLAISYINELMAERRDFPVHCVLAILKVNNPRMVEESRFHLCAIQDLVNTSLHYLSVLTSLKLDNEWIESNVTPLMSCLEISRQTALDLIMQLEYDCQIQKPCHVVYYMLRIINFFLARDLFWPPDVPKMIRVLNSFKENCTESDISRQPLFEKIYQAFSNMDSKTYCNYY